MEQSRKLVNAHQFNNEPLRILVASLASGLHSTDAFLASTLSKHMLRELRAHDAALKNPDGLRWNPVLKRYGVGSKVDDDEDEGIDAGHAGGETVGKEGQDTTGAQGEQPRPRLPTKENPVGVAVYGQICLAAKSYQSALCECGRIIPNIFCSMILTVYLLHAYDYCPHDPLICLCLAIASIGRAMQRQADNRHHLIAQVDSCLCVVNKWLTDGCSLVGRSIPIQIPHIAGCRRIR